MEGFQGILKQCKAYSTDLVCKISVHKIRTSLHLIIAGLKNQGQNSEFWEARLFRPR